VDVDQSVAVIVKTIAEKLSLSTQQLEDYALFLEDKTDPLESDKKLMRYDIQDGVRTKTKKKKKETTRNSKKPHPPLKNLTKCLPDHSEVYCETETHHDSASQQGGTNLFHFLESQSL
jgi:uncharacterized ubiquitin-like protein YukD